MAKTKPKILFTTPVLKHPATGGPYLRIENSIKALSGVSELYVYARTVLDGESGERTRAFYRGFCKEFHTAPSCRKSGVRMAAEGWVNRISMGIAGRDVFDGFESKADFKDLLDTADRIGADLIWLGYGNISYRLFRYIKENSNYKTVVDTDSVWSRFLLRGLPYHEDEAMKKKVEAEGKAKEEEELAWTNDSDVTTAVSEVDAEYYAGLTKHRESVMLFSNVIDMQSYEEKPPDIGIKRPSVYLAGSFWKNSPMEEAARWTIDKVMPIVWKEMPEAHFYVLGSGSKEVLSDVSDPRISVLGRVESVLPYICCMDAVLVPLKFESGTRFKILEAAACKRPVVSTTLGAEGLTVEHGKDIFIADTPEDFAAGILTLIKDTKKAEAVAKACHSLVARRYGLEKAREEALKILKYLKAV